MNLKVASLLFIVLPFTSCGQSAMSLRQVDWLKGNWIRQNVKEGKSAFETWEKTSSGEFLGRGVTLRGVDTVFVEKLRIAEKNNTLYYVADIKENSEPVFFEFTSISQTGFVCENPQHDFPKKIEYRLVDNKLTATISGDGKSSEFIFIKN